MRKPSPRLRESAPERDGEEAPLPPARGAVSTLFFVNGVVLATWASRIPDVQHHLRLTDGQLGLALLGMVAGAMPASSAVSALIARHGSRTVGRIAAAILCTTLPLPALAWSGLSLFFALLLLGAASASLNVSENLQGAHVESRYGRPIMISFHAMFSLGGLAGSLVGARVAAAGCPPRAHLIAMACLLVCIAAIAGRALLDAPPGPRHAKAHTVRTLRPLLILGIVAFWTVLNEGAMADWSAVYLHQDLGAATGVAALGYAAFTAMMVSGRATGDWLSHRIGDAVLVRGSALLAAVGLGTALLAGGVPAALLGFASVGLGCASVYPTMMRASARLPGVSPDAAISAVSTAGYAGFFVGPPLIGLLADHVTLRGSLALVVVGCLIIALLVPAEQRPDERGRHGQAK
jgi:fucose permease